MIIDTDSRMVERILSYREIDNPRSVEDKEYLVKYKGRSYRHCEWVKKEVIEKEKMGKQKIQRFIAKPASMNQDPFDPSFVLVDRIVDMMEVNEFGDTMTKFMLVKWCNLPYDEMTWEREANLSRDFNKWEEYLARQKVPISDDVGVMSRPHRAFWQKIEESPSYRNGNFLRKYQLEGLNWLLFCWFNRQNSILADEMGLGKTVQSVTLLERLYSEQKISGPFLVIAPLSTIPHWQREFSRWTPMNVIVYHGSARARQLLYDYEFYYHDQDGHRIPNRLKFNVLITTYEMIMAGASNLKPVHWRVAIIDEAHRLKNRSSKILETLKGFKMEHRVLLTGTPLQNNIEELWTLLNFLEPERFGSEREFMHQFGSLQSESDVLKLQKLLQPLMLRRLKEDVEASIPVKEETVIEVELTSIQKRYYRAILERNFSFLLKGSKGSNAPNLINTMMELRKCCIHPYLIQGAEETILHEANLSDFPSQFNCMIQSSGKLVLIDKLLPKLKAGGHKVLIFSQMTRCLDILEDYLRGRSYKYERIDGSIKGDLRQAAIDRFCKPGSEIFAFLLCTKAGGVGINLTAADTVIIFDSDWNPQNDIQAQARCHRIGQDKSVKVYRLITRNSYEREMFDKASLKLGLDRAVLQKMEGIGDEAKPPNLSKKEVEELLKKGAYGAVMEGDDVSQKFCEEDIDQILERRTIVIRHESTDRNSSFSKASFVSANSEPTLDINDPDFWTKWAKEAKVDPIMMNTDEQQLIVDAPRQRKQVQRFVDQIDFTESESDDEKREKRGFRPWLHTERLRLARFLLIYGYGSWKMIQFAGGFTRRNEKDIKACSKILIEFCLKPFENIESPVAECVKELVSGKLDGPLFEDWSEAPESEEEANRTNFNNGQSHALEHEEVPIGADSSLPYPNATKTQIQEYESFLAEARQDFTEGLLRKAKIFLQRIHFFISLRKMTVMCENPLQDMEIPNISTSSPANWWTDREDRSLIVGTLKHGYQQYQKIFSDPKLCFYDRVIRPGIPIESADGAEEDEDQEDLIEEKEPEKDEDLVEPITICTDSEMGLTSDLDVVSTQIPKEHRGEQQYLLSLAQENHESKLVLLIRNSELNVRLKRIVQGFTRQEKTPSRREKPGKSRRMDAEALKKKEEELAKRWTRKERIDFAKTISSYGLENTLEGKRIWDRFKEFSGISRKTDEQLEPYSIDFLECCRRVVAECENHSAPKAASSTQVEALALDNAVIEYIQRVKVGIVDVPSYDRAKRTISRVKLLDEIRDHIIRLPDLDELLAKPPKANWELPKWWITGFHDKGLLLGVIKYGFAKNEDMLNDPDLPFAEIVRAKREESGDSETIPTEMSEAPNTHVEMNFAIDKEKLHSNDMKLEDSSIIGPHVKAEQEPEEQDDDLPDAEEGDEHPPGDDVTELNPTKGLESKKGRSPSEILIGWAKDRFVFKRLNVLCRHITKTLHTTDMDSESNESYALAKRSGLKLTLKRTTSPADSEIKAKKSRKKEESEDGSEGNSLSQRAARKPQDVPRDENGNVVYPFKAGGVEVFSLGEIVYDRATFHSDKYIWPVGFSSRKEFRSIKDPDLRWHYRSRILDGGEFPLFEVLAEEDSSFAIVERSASTAWAKVVKAANEARQEERNCTVSGPEYFGYGHPTCVRLIQELPNVEKCANYVVHTFNLEKRSSLAKQSDSKKSPRKQRPSKRKDRVSSEEPSSALLTRTKPKRAYSSTRKREAPLKTPRKRSITPRATYRTKKTASSNKASSDVGKPEFHASRLGDSSLRSARKFLSLDSDDSFSDLEMRDLNSLRVRLSDEDLDSESCGTLTSGSLDQDEHNLSSDESDLETLGRLKMKMKEARTRKSPKLKESKRKSAVQLTLQNVQKELCDIDL